MTDTNSLTIVALGRASQSEKVWKTPNPSLVHQSLVRRVAGLEPGAGGGGVAVILRWGAGREVSPNQFKYGEVGMGGHNELGTDWPRSWPHIL